MVTIVIPKNPKRLGKSSQYNQKASTPHPGATRKIHTSIKNKGKSKKEGTKNTKPKSPRKMRLFHKYKLL